MAPPPSDVTRLLQEWTAGRRDAFDQLFSLLYDELRRLAASQRRRERTGHTLRATALVNEALGVSAATVQSESAFDPFRNDPRFQDLVRRVGLPAR
jgi:hypothetical protein